MLLNPDEIIVVSIQWQLQKIVLRDDGSFVLFCANAMLWFHGLFISNAKNINIYFQIKYTEAILSNSTRKLSQFQITELPNAVMKKISLLCYLLQFSALSSHNDRDILTNERWPEAWLSSRIAFTYSNLGLAGRSEQTNSLFNTALHLALFSFAFI